MCRVGEVANCIKLTDSGFVSSDQSSVILRMDVKNSPSGSLLPKVPVFLIWLLVASNPLFVEGNPCATPTYHPPRWVKCSSLKYVKNGFDCAFCDHFFMKREDCDWNSCYVVSR